MKNTFFSTLCLFFCSAFVQAQLLPSASSASNKSNLIKNGTVLYKMTVESNDAQAKMLNNSTFEYAFSGQDSKLAALVMGGLFSGNVILDGTASNGLALLSFMGQKKAIKMSAADLNKAQAGTADFSKLKVTPVSGVQKIASHSCKKIMLTDPANPDVQTIVFVCDNIKPESGGIANSMMNKLKGFPLGFEIKNKGSKIIIMASEVSTKIPKKSDFKLQIPEGYETTTVENLMEEFGVNTEK